MNTDSGLALESLELSAKDLLPYPLQKADIQPPRTMKVQPMAIAFFRPYLSATQGLLRIISFVFDKK